MDGLRAALIELNYTVHGTANERRGVTRLMLERDVLQPEASPGKSPRLELLTVDASQMKVTVMENGVEKTYAIPSGPLRWPGTNRLALANAAIADTIDLLSLLTDRIVLFHPKNETMAPEIQCHWTNNATTKAEAAQAIENSWQSRGVTAVLGGTKYLILAPPSVTNEIARSWVSPVATGPKVAPFVVHDINEAITKYRELTDRSITDERTSSESWFYLRTLKPVSKQEATWSIKMILGWGGCRIP